MYVETTVTGISGVKRSNTLSLSFCVTGIMSATGNGYVIYMTIKRKTKLKPPELMTVNLAIFDFGISGTGSCVQLQWYKKNKCQKECMKCIWTFGNVESCKRRRRQNEIIISQLSLPVIAPLNVAYHSIS